MRSRLIPPALAAVVGLWGVTVPSFWRDESVSAMAAGMSLSDLWRLLGAIDAVHALYYLLLRPFAALSTSELVLRLPSVIATAAAAYGIAVIGGRLASERAGLVAGAVYALLPIVSRYAQEARSYAIVSAVAVLATLTLLNALDGRRWRHYVWYAASLALLGCLHLFALLLAPAHAVTVLLLGRRELPRWVAAAGAAGLVVLPLALVASGQEQQVAWLKRPTVGNLLNFAHQTGGTWWAVALLAVLAAAGTVVALRRARPLALVALPWAVLPVALSFAISQVHPIYNPRYLLFCVPGVVLLAGAVFTVRPKAAPGEAARPPVPAALVVNTAPVLAVALLAVLVVPAQVRLRQPAARPDDLRTLASSLAAQERPGDAVLFVPRRYRLFVGVYGAPYDRLADLTFAPGRFEPRTAAQLRAVAGRYQRIWMVSPPQGAHWRDDERCRALLADKRFRHAPSQAFGRVRLTLFTRV